MKGRKNTINPNIPVSEKRPTYSFKAPKLDFNIPSFSGHPTIV